VAVAVVAEWVVAVVVEAVAETAHR